jgi:hypothetical protein
LDGHPTVLRAEHFITPLLQFLLVEQADALLVLDE